MKQSIYLKEVTKEYIQKYADEHNTNLSNAINLITEEHSALQQEVLELKNQIKEHKNLVTLYTLIKDNMIKLHDYIKTRM